MNSEANGLLDLGDVANARKDRRVAKERFEEALTLYQRMSFQQGIAHAHERLATVTTGVARGKHVRAAKEIWIAMELPEQAARVERRFR